MVLLLHPHDLRAQRPFFVNAVSQLKIFLESSALCSEHDHPCRDPNARTAACLARENWPHQHYFAAHGRCWVPHVRVHARGLRENRRFRTASGSVGKRVCDYPRSCVRFLKLQAPSRRPDVQWQHEPAYPGRMGVFAGKRHLLHVPERRTALAKACSAMPTTARSPPPTAIFSGTSPATFFNQFGTSGTNFTGYDAATSCHVTSKAGSLLSAGASVLGEESEPKSCSLLRFIIFLSDRRPPLRQMVDGKYSVGCLVSASGFPLAIEGEVSNVVESHASTYTQGEHLHFIERLL